MGVTGLEGSSLSLRPIPTPLCPAMSSQEPPIAELQAGAGRPRGGAVSIIDTNTRCLQPQAPPRVDKTATGGPSPLSEQVISDRASVCELHVLHVGAGV